MERRLKILLLLAFLSHQLLSDVGSNSAEVDKIIRDRLLEKDSEATIELVMTKLPKNERERLVFLQKRFEQNAHISDEILSEIFARTFPKQHRLSTKVCLRIDSKCLSKALLHGNITKEDGPTLVALLKSSHLSLRQRHITILALSKAYSRVVIGKELLLLRGDVFYCKDSNACSDNGANRALNRVYFINLHLAKVWNPTLKDFCMKRCKKYNQEYLCDPIKMQK